jgi:hypothetical protein
LTMPLEVAEKPQRDHSRLEHAESLLRLLYQSVDEFP